LRAVEQKRPDVALARRIWIGRRQPFMRNMLTRLAFIDETSLKTNMAKTTGWAERGARLVDHAPFGHWNTQTFIAALRHDRLDAPWVIGGAPLVHVNMHCRAADQPGILRPLCRNPTGPDPAKGRRRDTGQPCYPPKSEGRRDPERHRRLVRFSGKAVHWTPF